MERNNNFNDIKNIPVIRAQSVENKVEQKKPIAYVEVLKLKKLFKSNKKQIWKYLQKKGK